MAEDSQDRVVLQQSALAAFGEKAGAALDLDEALTAAARMVADTLQVTHAKVLEWLPDQERLLVRAGVGWAEGVVGHRTIGADIASPAGYALKSGEPVISNDLDTEERFRVPRLMHEAGVKSAVNAIIRSRETLFGVIEADSREPRHFTETDIRFLQGAANLLGLAIDRHRLGEANIALARHRETLLRELRHRVRNNVQLLSSLMNLQLSRTSFGETHTAIRALMSRVHALGVLEHHLYVEPDVDEVDLARYLMELLGQLVVLHGETAGEVRLETEIEQLRLPPDRAEAIGLIANEFVMNSFKHAFDARGGVLTTKLAREDASAVLILGDDGPGLPDAVIDQDSGLGLRLIHSLAAQLGGTVKLENAGGARLSLSFPLA